MAQMYGTMVGGSVVLSPDSSAGVPVVMAERPEAPEGYAAVGSFVQAGGEIRQVWELRPAEGTAAEATVALAKILAESLTDEQAAQVPALYDEWWQGNARYTVGIRVRYKGVLYKCLQTHQPQADWAPDVSPSLWARVLPGQSGEVGEWVQPDSTEGYSKGDRVTHGGKTWESIVDANIHEPGTDNGAAWVEVSA